jgi:hypothetical protein
VEHGDQDLVRDGHGGPQRTPARLQPVVLVLVVAALRPGDADRGLNGLEVNVALAGGRALLFSGALVIARVDPGSPHFREPVVRARALGISWQESSL